MRSHPSLLRLYLFKGSPTGPCSLLTLLPPKCERRRGETEEEETGFASRS